MKNKQLKKIHVQASKEYDILIKKDIIEEVGEIFSEKFKPCKVAIITDNIVHSLYSKKVKESLEKNGFLTCEFVFPNGEESKNINTYFEILSFLAKSGLSRTDLIVALGGGVVGDITGFSASTYLRGIKYVQIPTTLLAQIDSSVGGKTAIDLKEGKNLVGAFYQPELVLCDTNTLSTLKESTFLEGMGEGAKYLLLDKKVFDLVKQQNFDIEQFVYLCIDYKRQVVEQDEFEKGNRKLLNLGHTIAHGIEKLSNYKIAHGIAVAMGLNVILDASQKKGYITHEQLKDLKESISILLPTDRKTQCPYDIKEILDCAIFDKKRAGEYIDIIMIKGVGNCVIERIKINNLLEQFI